ncbi:MAG: bifunctional 4-hydroxy-2-oxoglutarate aldolase/2-dehydro-3-deoxy-phosphogluconate aldolase [Halieaceae bacterium]|nr:bifunctional 4-hydroxy-2-oxoglutarate aldolase/2-dehydro-3-deoxy-phosphogluconate aldolase [Halieaceae bacterium]MCP5202658.1 bifunctional 4-hydroxy-2-oxoglutarate aldolase/2-dehydro-3-deoxy-phosphogluconate aldolase [Pseudomonadales bacterium]
MLQTILEDCRVLPVVTAASVEATVQLARALQRGGMTAIEITLRSPAALDSIRAVTAQVPGMLVAAGTVTTAAELEQAVAAGATLALSPGATPALLRAAADSGVDFVPGVATASEIMCGVDHGFGIFKLFPAEALGGLALLKSLAGPFPRLRFCPTGGLHPGNFRDYLALPNVICCGGSWMVGADLVDNGKWDDIEGLARAAMANQ